PRAHGARRDEPASQPGDVWRPLVMTTTAPPKTCPDCDEPVIAARTENLRWQLLNPDPDPRGNVHARQDQNRNWFARSVVPGTPARFPEVLMMPHKATCGQPQAPAAQGVAFLDRYRNASSAHAARQRNKRGRRFGGVVTGIRWRPR